jgi:hypothetical protein
MQEFAATTCMLGKDSKICVAFSACLESVRDLLEPISPRRIVKSARSFGQFVFYSINEIVLFSDVLSGWLVL